ncbi:MAG TPA: hypothetical protein VHA57_07420 [Actinomycetota bacterium]|nr:hypothetical protein [Actinomycetota bacterium]
MNKPTILQMAIRFIGAAELVLGIVLWSGTTGTSLQHFHESVGILLVLCLWGLAYLAFKAKVPLPIVIVAVAWGVLAPIVGFAQTGIQGGVPVAVKVIHLIIGLGIIGLGEALGARIKRVGAPAAR